MLQTFTIKDQQLTITNGQRKTSNIFLLSSPSDEEVQAVCTKFALDPVIFAQCNSAEEISRFHPLDNSKLKDAQLLVTFDFNFDHERIEDQLTPVITIFNQDYLIICTQNSAVSFEKLQTAVADHDPIYQVVFHLVNAWQSNLNSALQGFEDEIDRLNAAAHDTIQDSELRSLTHLMRQLVYFEHTINDQTETLEELMESSFARSIDLQLKLKIMTTQRRLSKAIHIYRDAVESLSSLYTAMMDNRLNHLMKFLDSAGLVIGIAALLSGFMGMNVGGLPGRTSKYGFLITIGVAILIAALCTWYLRKKSYSD